MKTCMDQEQLQDYCHKQRLVAEVYNLFAHMRNESPVRQMRGQVGNSNA